MRLALSLGLSAATYAAVVTPPMVPHQVTAGSGYTGATSWPTVTGVGTGFGAVPTESATVFGSGYTQKVTAESTHVYYDYNPDYIMFIGGADYERTGALTWEIYFEDSAPVTFTQADYRWDPVRKIYGLPVQFLPRAGYSGIYRFYAKCIPTNGLERMISGEIWLNTVSTTGYYDRHANAIYVSGVDYNGSDSIGFAGVGNNTTGNGTSANPYATVNKAVQYAFGSKEGCYVYVKGSVFDDANGASRPTTTVPCRIMPWPGTSKSQCGWGKTARHVGPAAGEINTNINKYEVFSLTIDSDTIVKMQGNAATVMGFRNCTFLSGLSVDLDIWGYKKGIQQTVGTGNGQAWVSNSLGERNYMIDCDGSLYCAAGFQKVVCSTINYAWDAVNFATTAAGLKNIAFIGSKFTGSDFAYARFHLDEELTVAAGGVTLDGNGWTVITTTTANPMFSNTFETSIQFLTGTLAGQIFFGGQTFSATYPTGPAGVAAITGPTPPGAFPTGNRIYYKGDLTASIADGDKLRCWNHPHKDTGQFTTRSATSHLDPFVENIIYHNSAFVSKDAQWFLNQVGNWSTSTFPGTVSISAGTTATFSNSQTFLTGHMLHLTASNEYAMITAGGTGTVFTLDRALTTVSGAAFTIGSCIKDILIENCVFDTIDADDYQGQWQVGAININVMHSTFNGPSTSTSGQTTLRQNTAGFGVQDWVARNCIFRSMSGDSTGFPATGVTIANNHFIQGTARGTITTTGAASFSASGSVDSSYFPSAAVQTCSAVYLPYDRLGNARTAGAKVGVASA